MVSTADDPRPVSFTGRIAGWSARNRWKVVLGAAGLLVISFLLSATTGVKTSEVSGIRDSQKGFQLVEDWFEARPSFENVVIKNPALDVDDPAFRLIADPLVVNLKALDGVVKVESYYDAGAPNLVSDDKTVVIVRVELEKAEQADLNDFGEGILDVVLKAETTAAAQGFDLGVLGGAALNIAQNEVVGEDFQNILVISLIGALIILILAFGTVVAAVIPLGIAIISIFTAVGVATFVSLGKPLNCNFFE